MYTGILASVNFEENEITIQVKEKLIVKAGRYVVMPIEEYAEIKLVKYLQEKHNFECEHPYAFVTGKKMDLPKCQKCGKYL